MKHKKSSKNSIYEESDNNSSNFSSDMETFSEKSPVKKFTLTEISELEKQLKLLKEQAFKDNEVLYYKKQNKKQKKSEAVEQSDDETDETKQLPVTPIKETFKKKTNCKKKLIRPKEECTEWSSSDPEQVNLIVTLCNNVIIQ